MYPLKLPKAGRRLRRRIDAFCGLDRTRKAQEGALLDSRGLSFEHYPCLASRRGRAAAGTGGNTSALFAWGKLCTVEGTTLYYDGQAVGTVRPGEKQFAVVGSKLCIFPDKKYLDLTTRAFGDLAARAVNQHGLEALFTGNSLSFESDTTVDTVPFFSRNVRVKMNASEHRRDSGIYSYIKVCDQVSWDSETKTWSKSAEQELWLMDSRMEMQVGKYVILKESGYDGGFSLNLKRVEETRWANGGADVCSSEEVLQDYAPDSPGGLYGIIREVEVESRDYLYYGESYVKDVTITLEVHNAEAGNRGFEGRFFPGDRVFLWGCAGPNNFVEKPLTIEAVAGHTIIFRSPDGQESFLEPGVETGPVTVERRVPDLDFICEGEGRLFGVNNATQTIWASARGDALNFEVFDGQAGDSWRQQVGTAGDFTGCIACAGSVLFWKEDCLHRVMGARPSAYQVSTFHYDGVQKGSHRSMVVLGETLYYKGRDGVYAYAGSAPKLISAPLGNARYDSAAAGGCGGVYRIAMRRQDTGAWELFSYRLREKLWLKEDEREASAFAGLDGRMYMLSEGAVLALDSGEGDAGEAVAWEALFVPVEGEGLPVRLALDMELAPGAWAEAELARDGGVFRSVWSGHGPLPGPAVIPLRPGPCRSWQLRLRGEGGCVLKALEREGWSGGEGG